eukprot:scaffold18987_cov109-Isochrysis_galbana.AAC.4
MSGERDVNALIKSMSATLVDGLYVFCTVPSDAVPTGLHARMQFQEAEGTTLILLLADAQKAGLKFEYPCRMITLSVQSSLEAVGFIARVAAELSKHGLGRAGKQMRSGISGKWLERSSEPPWPLPPTCAVWPDVLPTGLHRLASGQVRAQCTEHQATPDDGAEL